MCATDLNGTGISSQPPTVSFQSSILMVVPLLLGVVGTGAVGGAAGLVVTPGFTDFIFPKNQSKKILISLLTPKLNRQY
jgi:hypothetical protein